MFSLAPPIISLALLENNCKRKSEQLEQEHRDLMRETLNPGRQGTATLNLQLMFIIAAALCYR